MLQIVLGTKMILDSFNNQSADKDQIVADKFLKENNFQTLLCATQNWY